MAIVLEEDGELAYCLNCGKAELIPPDKDVPEGWICHPVDYSLDYMSTGGEQFCSEACETEWFED